MNPQDVTYTHVENLLENAQPRGGRLQCTFRCPESAKTVVSTADVQAPQSFGGRWAARAGQGVVQTLVYQFRRNLGRSLGRGPLARMANDFVAEAGATTGQQLALSRSAKEATVVAAFRAVAGQFEWNADAESFRLRVTPASPPKADPHLATTVAGLLLGLAALAPDASAQELRVYTVGGDKAAGKTLASEHGGRWAKNPTKAFRFAAEALASGGDLDVVIRFAEGEFDGDLGSGSYTLPSFRNAQATLTFEGGWSADFTTRDPFGTPTRFVTNSGRSQPYFKFFNSRPADQDELEALTLDGLLVDVAGSNNYDAETVSLLKRGSCTHRVIHFGYLRTNLLAVRNCAFLNAPERAFDTLIRCASDEAEIHLSNNLFLNNVVPVKLDTARYRHKAARIVVEGNSFLLNWAMNPDPDTSNPGSLEIASVDSAAEVIVQGNLFYSNFGGAIQALDMRLPALTINANNFVGNGLLHGETGSDAVAMIVTAGSRKQPLGMDLLEDVMAVDEAEDNVSIAPGLPLAFGEVKPVDASQVKVEGGWENEVRSMLGLNLQGGTVAIHGYAPKKEYDPAQPPVPVVPEAAAYGFSPERAKTPMVEAGQ